MILRNGDSGQLVIQLQVRLQEMGIPLPEYGIDGKFGPETQSAVLQAQRWLSLPATGEADKQLLSKLGISITPSGMKANKSTILTKTILTGIAIGALLVISKKMRSRLNG